MGSVSGMVQNLVIALTVFVVLSFVIQMIMLRGIIDAMRILDEALVEAISGIQEGMNIQLPEGFEPPNPIQAAIASWIQGNLTGNQPNQALLERNEKGQFETQEL